MATIINNPSGGTSEDSSAGIVVGLVVALILIVLFIMFVWPSIKNNRSDALAPGETPAGASANINVSLPGDGPASSPAGY